MATETRISKSQQRNAWNKAITPFQKGTHTLQQFLDAAGTIDPRIASATEGIYFGPVGAAALEVPGSGGIWFIFCWYADAGPNSYVEPKVEYAYFS